VKIVKPEPEIPDILKIRKPVYNPEDFDKKKRKRKSYRYKVVNDANITCPINESEQIVKLENSENEILKNEGEVIEASLSLCASTSNLLPVIEVTEEIKEQERILETRKEHEKVEEIRSIEKMNLNH
jgi:hypothetical protein